jgi:hypothetical protein
MTDKPDLWEVRRLPNGLTLELSGGGNPVVVLVQGERRVSVDLPHVKPLVAALTDAEAD